MVTDPVVPYCNRCRHFQQLDQTTTLGFCPVGKDGRWFRDVHGVPGIAVNTFNRCRFNPPAFEPKGG